MLSRSAIDSTELVLMLIAKKATGPRVLTNSFGLVIYQRRKIGGVVSLYEANFDYARWEGKLGQKASVEIVKGTKSYFQIS